jgi:hypothetical protein
MFHDAWPRYRLHFDDADKDKDGFLNLQVWKPRDLQSQPVVLLTSQRRSFSL